MAVLEMVVAAKSGRFFVIYDRRRQGESSLPMRYLDGGKLLKALDDSNARQILRADGQISDQFKAFDYAFDDVAHAGMESDKWSRQMLERVMDRLGENHTSSNLEALLGEPTDGAVMLSLNGTVVGAAVQVLTEVRFELLRSTNQSAGTRHSAAVNMVAWLQRHGLEGVS